MDIIVSIFSEKASPILQKTENFSGMDGLPIKRTDRSRTPL